MRGARIMGLFGVRMMITSDGWMLEKQADGAIVVTKDGLGGCVVHEKPRQPREIPESILWQLVTDLLNGKVINAKS